MCAGCWQHQMMSVSCRRRAAPCLELRPLPACQPIMHRWSTDSHVCEIILGVRMSDCSFSRAAPCRSPCFPRWRKWRRGRAATKSPASCAPTHTRETGKSVLPQTLLFAWGGLTHVASVFCKAPASCAPTPLGRQVHLPLQTLLFAWGGLTHVASVLCKSRASCAPTHTRVTGCVSTGSAAAPAGLATFEWQQTTSFLWTHTCTAGSRPSERCCPPPSAFT